MESDHDIDIESEDIRRLIEPHAEDTPSPSVTVAKPEEQTYGKNREGMRPQQRAASSVYSSEG